MRIIAFRWYQLELISIGLNPSGVTTLPLDFLRFFRLKSKMGHGCGSQNARQGVFTDGGHPQCVALYIWSHSQTNRKEIFISEDFKSSAEVNVIY